MLNREDCNLKTRKVFGTFLILGLLITFSFSINTFAQSDNNTLKCQHCVNCFYSQVISSELTDGCLTIKLEVFAGDSCSSALSHFTVGVPCGEISKVSNSEDWDIENPSTDPTTGISGFKIDNISNFGEDNTAGVFTVEYSVCSDEEDCLQSILDKITVAYKAGTCIFYQDIKNQNKLTASLTQDNISCYGGNNGAIYTDVNGGTPPYSYVWSNGSSTQNISGLRFGEYEVTITDDTGESINLSTELIQPESPITIEGDITNASCNNNDGAIDITVSGGTPPYSYVWTGDKTTEDLNNTYAGTYSIRVFDSVGCTKSASYTVTENSDLELTVTPNYLHCHQEGGGEITSSVSGGTEPYQYMWSNNDTTANISSVNSGSYSLTVTDVNGCSTTKSTYIGISSMSLSTSVVNPSCNGGDDGQISISNIYYGTEPYIYLWDTGDTTAVLSNISAGRYRVTVTDSNGCQVTRTINLADRQPLDITYSIATHNCESNEDITINLSGSGGQKPYHFYYDETEISSSFAVNSEGDYEITMKDALGCETTETITISNSETILNINANISQPSCGGASTGAAEIYATGGTSPYQFNWSDGSTSQNRDNLAPGEYQVEAIDANGCYSSTSITITEAKAIKAAITEPTQEILCQTGGLTLYSVWEGADTYTWEVISDDNSWYIENSSIDDITIYVGKGTSSIIYTVINNEGCFASDTISISCLNTDDSSDNSDNNNEDDTCNNDSNSSKNEEEHNNCFYSKITSITPTDQNGCYTFTMYINTNGECDHELSHMTVGIDNATINSVYNSDNYPTESNFTDPTTGLYGFKIDEIKDFGKSGEDKIKVEFEACFNSGTLPDTINIAYKAANGYTIQSVNIFESDESESTIDIHSYPNPFKEDINFSVVTKTDCNGELALYNSLGQKIKIIYCGTFLSNIEYSFSYHGGNICDKLIFYKLSTNKGDINGKLLKTK